MNLEILKKNNYYYVEEVFFNKKFMFSCARIVLFNFNLSLAFSPFVVF